MNEERVIGIIANHPEQYHVAKDALDGYVFRDSHAENIWLEFFRLWQNSIPTSFYNAIKSLAEDDAAWLDAAREQAYGDDVTPYCAMLVDEQREDNFRRAIHEAQHQDNPADYLERAIEAYRDRVGDKSQTFKDLITKTVDFIETVSDGGDGIKTGFKCIDRQMGGLQKQRIMIVAARTGVGKTAMTMQMALHAARQNIAVGVCSLEMGDAELGIRSVSHATKANVSGLYRADDEALLAMTTGMAHHKIADWPVYFNTDQYRLDDICNQIRVWVKRDKIQLAVVDHIGLVEVPQAQSANERLGMVTRAMKKLAKSLDIPIILVSQLNRANDKENRPPRLSDLRDSGSIEQDADIVILMHKLNDKEGAYVRHDLNMAKNRQGPTGTLNAIVTFKGATQTFTEELGYSYDH